MIFMMLAVWYRYGARKGGTFKIALATFFGILGYWTRQDHLGAIAGLAFLAFEPAEGPTGGWRGYWDRIKLHWQRLQWLPKVDLESLPTVNGWTSPSSMSAP